MTNEKINATVEEIMEYEALLDEVKGIVDGLKDNLKNEMAERKVESLSTDRYTVRWTEVLTSKFNSKGILYNVVDDKHFSITAPVEISDQFYGWVLGFGNKAKILKPQKVVEGFTEYLDKIRNIYES